MNFKKNGIFGRREDGGQREAEYDGYGSPNQVLAVWGSPGSGKTTVAVKLAKKYRGAADSISEPLEEWTGREFKAQDALIYIGAAIRNE